MLARLSLGHFFPLSIFSQFGGDDGKVEDFWH